MIEMNRLRTSAAILAVGAAGLFAVGCGGDDSSTSTSDLKDSFNKQIDEAQKNLDKNTSQQIEDAQKQLNELGKQAGDKVDQAQNSGQIPEVLQKQIDEARKKIEEAAKQNGQ